MVIGSLNEKYLMQRIEEATRKEVFIQREKEKELAHLHFTKSENDLYSARIERLLLKDSDLRKHPMIKEYVSWDWLIIKSYYSMYHIILSLLAKLGIKTKTHYITLVAFEFFFVKKDLVDKKYLNLFNQVKESAKVTEEILNDVKEVRQKRFSANYDVESTIIEREANACFEKAEEFIAEMKKIYTKL